MYDKSEQYSIQDGKKNNHLYSNLKKPAAAMTIKSVYTLPLLEFQVWRGPNPFVVLDILGSPLRTSVPEGSADLSRGRALAIKTVSDEQAYAA
jgi:hypothetical protein